MTDVKDDIVPKKCPNCGTWMDDSKGEYCPGCGQKYTTGLVTVRQLLADGFEAVFNFESKAYKTFYHLFVPGRLTNEYLAGRQKRYVTPLRLFLLTAILHFAVIAYLVDRFAGPQIEQALVVDQSRKAFRADFGAELDSVMQETQDSIYRNTPQVAAAFDTVRSKINYTINDSTNLGSLTFMDMQTQTLKVDNRDLYGLSVGEILDKYEVEGFSSRLITRQQIRIVREADNAIGFFLGKLTWMVLLMMPALALILKLLYIRRRRYYIEHLIFSFHYHAFAFLLLSLTAMLDVWLETYGVLTGIGFGAVLIYLFVAMVRVYRQNWFKTLVKFFVLNSFYLTMFGIFLTLTLIVSAFLF